MIDINTPIGPPGPYYAKLSEMIKSDDPGGSWKCWECRKQTPNANGLVCIHCGDAMLLSEDDAKQAIEAMEKKRLEKAEAAQAAKIAEEIEQAAPKPAPPLLDDVIGNASAVAQIKTALEAHRARLAKLDGRTAASKALVFPHTIFSASGGTGKSMLAKIIASELGRPFRLVTGQSLQNPNRVAEMLMSIKVGDIIFIDEIQSLKDPCQTALLLAMEDGIVVPVTKTGSPTPVRIPPFTLIAATTDEYRLSNPLLQRFKYIVHLQRMTVDDLARAIGERAVRNGWTVTAEAAALIAQRAHGTPRLALRLLDACMDAALAGGEEAVDAMIAEAACEVNQIDSLGLNRSERRYLELLDAAGGGPVRPNIIAAQMDNQTRLNLERKIEPELLYLGLIEKTQSGRQLTPAGREHIKETR